MVEVQDIFREFGQKFIERYNPPPHVCKSIRAISNCRTEALGAHADHCDNCGYTHISYNSCRDRHCPKCQALRKEMWIMDRQSELLPVPYFHVVFSLPNDLDVITMQNQDIIYNILFRASAETLKELSADPKYLGAQPGFISILHTWGQTLTLHPHVHMIVPGGGLALENTQWKNSGKKFFLPVKVMSSKFRGKFLHYLKQANLSFHGPQEYLADLSQFDGLISRLFNKDWYVYCKRPFKTTDSVLEYLGRYTHRVAISNHRILKFENDIVTFKWRDYSDHSAEKVMSLHALEFMRRFLLHILPPGFTKIRHYGFLGSAVKAVKLILCRRLLGCKPIIKVIMSTVELIKKLTGIDISICPNCGVPFTKYLAASP